MRAYKFLSIDGKEAVMVGEDNKLPALDASSLINVTSAIKGGAPEILSVIPVSFAEADIGRVFVYLGEEEGYDKYATYVIEYSEGEYSIHKISASPDSVGLPSVTGDDNNKILVVLEGVWSVGDAPISATTANVQTALSVDTAEGVETKVLSEKGTFVELPTDTDTTYSAGNGIDITNETISIDVTGATTGQVLKKTELGIGWAGETVELPVVTTDDNNKVLTVVSGAWATADLPAKTVELPVVTVDDNDKVLTVVAGAWSAGTAPVGVTTANVQSALGIDTENGLATKVLNKKGTFIDLPEGGGGPSVIVSKSADYQLLETDARATVLSTGIDDVTFTLPLSMPEGNWFTFVKMGSGKITIQAPTGEQIMDSGLNGTLFCDSASTMFVCTLEKVASGTWILKSGTGLWETA